MAHFPVAFLTLALSIPVVIKLGYPFVVISFLLARSTQDIKKTLKNLCKTAVNILQHIHTSNSLIPPAIEDIQEICTQIDNQNLNAQQYIQLYHALKKEMLLIFTYCDDFQLFQFDPSLLEKVQAWQRADRKLYRHKRQFNHRVMLYNDCLEKNLVRLSATIFQQKLIPLLTIHIPNDPLPSLKLQPSLNHFANKPQSHSASNQEETLSV